MGETAIKTTISDADSAVAETQHPQELEPLTTHTIYDRNERPYQAWILRKGVDLNYHAEGPDVSLRHLLADAINNMVMEYDWGLDERDGLEATIQWLEGTNKDRPSAEPIVILLTDPARADAIVGVRISSYYPESETAYLEYVIIDEHYRGKSLLKPLVELSLDELTKTAEASGKELKGVFTDIRNPQYHQEDEARQNYAIVRIQKLKHALGMIMLDVPDYRNHYNDGSHLLASYPFNGNEASSDPKVVQKHLLDRFANGMNRQNHPAIDESVIAAVTPEEERALTNMLGKIETLADDSLRMSSERFQQIMTPTAAL